MTVGERIKQIRKQRGMTQGDLTELMGYKNKSTVCTIEKGNWQPSYKVLLRFAQALHCTPEDLMGVTEQDAIQSVTSIMRMMDEAQQRQVLTYAKYIMENSDAL